MEALRLHLLLQSLAHQLLLQSLAHQLLLQSLAHQLLLHSLAHLGRLRPSTAAQLQEHILWLLSESD